MLVDHSLWMLDKAEEKIFNSLNGDIKDFISNHLLYSEQKIAHLIFKIFHHSPPTQKNQTFLRGLLTQMDTRTQSSLQKISLISEKGYFEKLIDFAHPIKKELHSKKVMTEIIQLFFSAMEANTFSTVKLPFYEEGGKELLQKLKANIFPQNTMSYATLSVLTKQKLEDGCHSFQEKQKALIKCLEQFPAKNRLTLEVYDYFFSMLQEFEYFIFSNEEKNELLKIVFNFTSHAYREVFQYDQEDIYEFLANALMMRECYDSEGFLLFCFPLSLHSEATFSDISRCFKLLVGCENSLNVIELIEKFNSHAFSFEYLLSSLEEAFGKLSLQDSLLNENIENRLIRFLKDPDVLFSIGAERLELMKRQYEEIQSLCRKYQKFTLQGLIKQGSEWRKKAEEGQLNPSQILELIAIGRMAMHLHFEIYPDSTQILVVLGLLIDQKNWLAQVKTGEGKSIIVAIMVFLFAMHNRAVDVITSARYLATRDYERFRSFYKLFGISSSHISYDLQEPKHFRGQILYGTVTDFEFAYMRDQLNGQGLFNARKHIVSRNFDCVIVDEVDNLLIDTAQSSARVAYPAKDNFVWIYAPILKFVKLYPLTASPRALRAYIEENSDSSYDTALKEISDDQLATWLNSAKIALYKREPNKDYIIQKKKNAKGHLQNTILIVDAENTGRILKGSRWSEGIHEFIEVKHDIEPAEESLVPLSLSHAVFYKFYRTILGLSGTLGEDHEREEINEIYNIESFDAPPHFPSQRKDLKTKILETNALYFQEILNSLLICQNQGRPVLVLCETIQETEELSGILKANNFNFQLLNEVQEERDVVIIARAGRPDSITVATNTASRGTDIHLSHTSLVNGGLHVILTFYPQLKRVYYQMIGRGGRRGQAGSSEMILSKERGQLVPYKEISLSDESLLEILEKKREASALTMQQIRVKKAHHENLLFHYTSQFFDKLNKWLEQANHENFCNYHSERLCKLRLFKLKNFQTSHLAKENKIIAEECIKLLTHSIDKQVSPNRWKNVLNLCIENIKDRVITHWAIHFYHIAQSSLTQDEADHFELQIKELFNTQQSSWENDMQEPTVVIFKYLYSLIQVNLAERKIT